MDPFVWWHSLSNEAKAAWVQAIGSLLAIGATLLIAHIDRRRVKQALKHSMWAAQAAFVFTAMAGIKAWCNAIQKAQVRAREYLPPSQIDPGDAASILEAIDEAFDPDRAGMAPPSSDMLTLGSEGFALHRARLISKSYAETWRLMRPSFSSGENLEALRREVIKRLDDLNAGIYPAYVKAEGIMEKAKSSFDKIH